MKGVNYPVKDVTSLQDLWQFRPFPFFFFISWEDMYVYEKDIGQALKRKPQERNK